jgi:membrane protease YdiL (CAAX protease family)
VPADFWTATAAMLAAGAAVAAVAVPAGLIAWVVARRPLPPRWKPWRVPWGGFEVAGAFLVLTAVVPPLVELGLAEAGFYPRVYGPDFPTPRPTGPPPGAEMAVAGAPAVAAAQDAREVAAVVRRLWAGVVALPVQLGLLVLARRALYPAWRPPDPPGLAPRVAVAVAAWAVLTPVVLAVNSAVNWVFTQFEAVPDEHQLTRLGGRGLLDSAAFLFQACVAAPVVEEVVFRGLVLAWALGGRKPLAAPDAAPAARPWLVVLAGVGFAALSGRPGPVAFAAVLAGGLAVVTAVFRSKRRTAGAVWASAALFAAVHSPVWPSPVALFLLGLGLGWCAVRTRGVLVPAVVHGLFNAVSAVFVLRGGA